MTTLASECLGSGASKINLGETTFYVVMSLPKQGTLDSLSSQGKIFQISLFFHTLESVMSEV
jgi:hypothetical protein